MFMYTCKMSDKGKYGDAFELAVKAALNRKNADRISGQGKEDFIYDHIHYEVKQNAGVLKYALSSKFLRGSNRVIYAPHISVKTVATFEGADGKTYVTLAVDLFDTQMYILDRKAFLKWLKDTNSLKFNSKRGEVNIQTMWNYTQDAPAGARARKFEAWAYDNELDDDIIDRILEGAGA